MNPSEAATVMTVASGIDNRAVSREVAMIWAQTLDQSMTADDASRAVVEHYSESTEWLKPGHINAIVRRWRRNRMSDLPSVVPPRALADLPRQETAWKRVWSEAMVGGCDEISARRIANQAFDVIEDEPLAVEESEAMRIKATKQIEDMADKITQAKSVEAVERAAKAEAFRKFKADRATTLTDGEATA